jgi:hypothetical protein
MKLGVASKNARDLKTKESQIEDRCYHLKIAHKDIQVIIERVINSIHQSAYSWH